MVGVACAVIMEQEKLVCGKNGNKKNVKLVKVMKKTKKKVKATNKNANAAVVVSKDKDKEAVGVAAAAEKKNDEVSVSNFVNNDNNDEVEEGELGTLPIENEFVPTRKFEIKSEIEKGEYVPGRWRRNTGEFEVEKGEFVPERYQNQYGGYSKNNRRYDGLKEKGGWKYDRGGWTEPPGKERGWKYDRENDWSQPNWKEKGWKGDYEEKGWKFEREREREYPNINEKDKGWKEWSPSLGKDKGWKFEREREREWTPVSSGKYLNNEKEKGWREWSPSLGKDNDWKFERKREREWTPPSSGKYSSEKDFGGKNGGGSQQFRKFNSRYDAEKKPNYLKSDLSNGKNHGKDDYFGNRLKRPGNDFETNERKYRNDYDEYAGSAKVRKLPDDGNHYPGRTYKKPAGSSSRNIPSERYPSRYPDSSGSIIVNDGRVSSPHQPERSPNDRFRHYDRAHSPSQRDRSPYERGHVQDRRDRSPYERGLVQDRRDRSPYERAHMQDRSRSPYDHKGRYDSGRNHDDRDRSPTYMERSPLDRGKHNKQWETDRKAAGGVKRLGDQRSKEQEGRYNKKDEESQRLAKESESKENLDNGHHASEKVASSPHHQEEIESSSLNNQSSLEKGVTEELESMEEDMDICNTPPHVPAVVDHAVSGKWYYLDQFGEEKGPTKLSDLKALVEEGHLASDHFIKHLDINRWITVENAVSPLRPANFPSVVPDSVTQLACPPEASGNLLEDNGKGTMGNLDGEETLATSLTVHESESGLAAAEPVKDLNIDERVGTFSKGVILVPGREHEMVAEMLEMANEPWERWQNVEGYIWHQHQMVESSDDKVAADLSIVSEHEPNDLTDSEKDNDTSELFSGRWALKGGDWKINDEASQDRTWKRKQVLNDGYPLCQMSMSCCEDPRWQRKDELYCPSQSRRLDLPSWAFSSLDEVNDPKSMVLKGIKGTTLPVIRINACVVNDHGSFISEPRAKARGKERYPTKSLRPYSTTGDSKRSSEDSHSKSSHELDSLDSWKKTELFTVPKDRLCKADELQLHLGDWYYLDGAGHELGPSSFSELLRMADQGVIQNHSSVYRKPDKIWVPLNSLPKPCRSKGVENNVSGGFHDLHPQFIGFTRGKLHELVMKSYKSREFAAAINEVLNPWISTRQPNDHLRVSKRARTDEAEEEYGLDEDESTLKNDECSFDDLCSGVTFSKGGELVYNAEGNNWDLLDGHVLARIFHFLRADLKSLFYAALTCKHWRSSVKIYKDVSTQVDFCGIAPNGTDGTALKIMNEYNREKIKSLILRDCTGVTSALLEELLRSFTSLSYIDIRGCPQLEDLVVKFPHINWIKNSRPKSKIHDSSQLNEKGLSASQMEYSSGLTEYLENSDKAKFRHSLYKRSKLFDARKSSSISSRDAQLRRLAMKKYGNGYKRMEEFIAISLEEIMKGNTFSFFETKVADIEERMKNGYYASRGLNAVKEDISCMCRDAIKTKNRGDTKDLNRIVKLFIQLATSLEKGSKLAYGKDEIMQSWKDNVPPGFSSSSSKYKKNPNKSSERKQPYRSNGSSFVNGFIDSGDVASDREIRRRLSKLNKKSLDSESDTSDDFDKSSFGSVTNSETTASDTESDVEFHSEGSKREECFTSDYGFDSLADEREWGARMTKASLVPPVTRKYEVIDHYVIVADEEEVKRKMQVSLPEDYTEKLNAQRTGTDESDMEIPEVKDFKPRKSVGDEVIEQEVYGIDPYTHNLLLDSMPDEPDWSLADKHLFIEDVLLRSLNKKVRNFTGSGNTPMVYSLKPVFQEILENAKEKFDKRTVRLCHFILKAIDSRPEDKYVAYRKGLGVVCYKEGGFSEDDFVVEFLGEVYPTWKWYEKQDGIRALQKNKDEQAPEFYNIYLERPKGDADGYDLVVVDAMHKANYASRICHSCKPNCEAKVTAVDGQYQIGIYSVRPIAYGEEVTFDYNSVTESKEEYEASVCLCGNQVCRGSYLNLTGEGAYQKVLKEYHGLLDRHRLLLEACELNLVSEEDYIELGKAGLGSCLLGGLPDWLIAYTARLVRFINFERTKLPSEIFKHNIEEKKKYFAEVHLDVEKSDAEIQAEGVYNQRLQNLALTIDKVKYVMRCVFGDPKKAPPPLERLSPEEAVSHIWKGEGSFVEELIQCMGPHMEDIVLRDLKAKIQAHDPSVSQDMENGLRKSLLWLRDEVRNLPCTYKSRHDAAADLIHVHAYTKSFIRIREYKSVTSPPVHITPLDLGPKYANKLGPGVHEYCKTYGEMYCLGQLMFWHSQNAEPDAMLGKASRGCLSLPDIGSFYAKFQKPARQRVYGPKTVKFMVSRMEKQPQKPWPKDRIWSFKTSVRIVGSPMLDTVLHGDTSSMDKEMLQWLKHRRSVFQAPWDR